jgi:hypothetical protein
MQVSLIPLSVVSFIILSLLGHSILFYNTPLAAQTGNLSNIHSEKLGVKITNPRTNSNVSVGTLLVNGTSTDTPMTNCRVYIDWNDLKPMQNVTSSGPGGINDYSEWSFKYTQAYHLIVEGANELTSKISCHDGSTGNITTKFYSINVTGINNTTRNIITPSSSFSNSNETNNNKTSGYHSVTFHGILPQYNEGTGTANHKSSNNKEDSPINGGDANAEHDGSSNSLNSNDTNTLPAKESRDNSVRDDNIELTANLKEHLASNAQRMDTVDKSKVNEDNNDTDVKNMSHHPNSTTNIHGVHISQGDSLESSDIPRLQSSDEVAYDHGTMAVRSQGSNVKEPANLMTELENNSVDIMPRDKGQSTVSDTKGNFLKNILDKNDINNSNQDTKVKSKKNIDKDKDLKPIKAKKLHKKNIPAPVFDNKDPFRLT